MQLYELAEELGTGPEALRSWLKKRGLGGKGKLSMKAVSQARAQFKVLEGAMAEAVAEPAKSTGEGRAQRAPVPQMKRRRSWGKAEPVGPSVEELSTDEQRDLIKQLRGRSDRSPQPAQVADDPQPSAAAEPSPAPAHESKPEAPPTPSAPAQPNFTDHYYKKQYETLYNQYTAQRERLKKTDLALKELQSAHEELKRQRPMEQSPAPTGAEERAARPEAELVWEELSSFQLSEQDAVFALLEVLEHPARGPELLYRLKLDEPSILLRGFRFYCGHELCYELAQHNARFGLIQVEDKHCVICEGHEAQRWYSYLLHIAEEQGLKRLLLVGGEDANTSTLKSFERSRPRLSWGFVNGDGRDDQTSANARVEGADGVLLWGGMNLPHRISNLYKQACEVQGVPCATIIPGQRGVSAICKTALKMLGVSEEEL